MVMMRLPPGVPITATLSWPSRKLGVIDDNGRLPGAIALASSPINPNAFGTPGFTEKSSISLLRSEEHTSELQSLMRNSYDVFCLTKKKINTNHMSYSTTKGKEL